MAFLIDTIDSSGLFAQSANSATIATKDSNGNDITATYQTIADMSGYQPSGNYVTTPDLSSYATEQWVNDQAYMHEYMESAFYSTANPSGFITGVDLTPYQKIEDMSAYQPSGDYYSASNPSGFITDVPTGTLNESAFEFDNGLISAYNGSAFKAGDELPSGVMNTSALEFDGSDISGYDGSAFKDVALGDVISSNSGAWGGDTRNLVAGDGIGINLDAQDVIISSTYGADISALTAQSANWNEVSSKQDTLTFNYDNDNAISAINGSALAGGGSITFPITGASGIDSASYSIDRIELIHHDTEGEPELTTAYISTTGLGIDFVCDENYYGSVAINNESINFTNQDGTTSFYPYDIDTWNNASAVSGMSADITAISAEIGDVESLLASL